MRATGKVRKIGSVGSVVLPKEMMKSLGINNGDLIEFLSFAEGYLILRKHKPNINVLEDIQLTEDEIRENNAYNLNLIDETISCICQPKIRSKDHLILGHFFDNKCASENCTKAQSF